MNGGQAGQVAVLLAGLASMLAVALVCGQAMRRLRQPPVLGELVGGVLLGPTVLGALCPDLHLTLYPADGPVAVGRDAVLQIGMLFFLFAAGNEVDLGGLRGRAARVTLTSALGCLVPFGLGFGSVALFPGIWQASGARQPLLLALSVGTALSISALPVITRLLLDLRLARSEVGITVIAAATVNDLAGWSLFAVILSASLGGGTDAAWLTPVTVVGFATLVLLAGRRWGPGLLRWARVSLAWPSGFLGVVSVLVLAAAAGAEALGIHAIFGAFLVGAALGQHPQNPADNPVPEIVHQFAVSFFAPLYFVSVGLKADFAASFDPRLALLVIAIATCGKVAGAGLGARLGGMSWRQAAAVGFGMNARGAMEIVLASVALDSGLIDQRVFVALVAMALATSLLSGPALVWLLRPGRPAAGGPVSSESG